MENNKNQIGTQIRVNGQIETLIKISGYHGLFKGESGYKVVRNLMFIKQNEIIK